MSSVKYEGKVSPGDAVESLPVRRNFVAVESALDAVTTDNIDDGSVFTRHMATDRGAWKIVTSYPSVVLDSGVHAELNTSSALTSDFIVLPVPDTATTYIETEPGQAVLVMCGVPVAMNHVDRITKLELGIYVDTTTAATMVAVKTVDVRWANDVTVTTRALETTFVQMFCMFVAKFDQHLIQLRIMTDSDDYDMNGRGNMQVIAVRS
jgi:hypothetical protein